MSLVKNIRQELLKLYGLLKHGETAAEQVVQERLGTLHDNLIHIEAKFASIEVGALKEIRALAGKASSNVLKHVDEAIAAADQHAANLQAAAEKAQAAAREQAAKAALTPAPAAEVAQAAPEVAQSPGEAAPAPAAS